MAAHTGAGRVGVHDAPECASWYAHAWPVRASSERGTPIFHPDVDMDLGLAAGVVMLIGWAIATFWFSGPGWVHLFLSLGVFLVIWRIAARSAKKQTRD